MESTGAPGAPPPDEAPVPQEAAPPPPAPPAAATPPPPPAPPAAASTPPAWMANLTSTAPVAGPAGLVYADLPNRIIAYIIDMIALAIVALVVNGVILSNIGLNVVTFDLTSGFHYNYVAALIQAAVSAALSAAYFIYMWTAMRGTIGMKALGMQIGDAKDGTTLSMNQAIRRWFAVGGWITVAQALNPIPLLGIVIALAALGYVIYLLYTTAQSPTKQGFHDKFVGSMVVKTARSVA